MTNQRDWANPPPNATEMEKVFATWVKWDGIDGAIRHLLRSDYESKAKVGQLKLKLRKAKEIIRWMASEMGAKE